MLGIREHLEKKDYLFILGMTAFTAFLYFPSLSYDFLHTLDDDWLITYNPYIQDFSLKGVYNLFFVDTTDFHYHPLTYLSIMLDYKLFGLNPMGYKIHNLLLHLACGAMMYLFLMTLTKNRFVSFVTVFIFLIHPLNMDSIVWASCRRQSLFYFYFLFSCQLYLLSCIREDKQWRYFLLAVFLAIISMLIKATAIIFPFVFVLIFFVVKNKLKKIVFFQVLLAIPILIFFVYLNEIADARNYLKRDFDYSLLEHLVFAGYSYFFYWYKTIVAFPLAVFYPAPSENLAILPAEYYIFFVAALITGGLIIYHYIKKQWLHFFALMYYSLSIGMLLNLMFFPLGDLPMLVSNRYYYHSCLGILMYISLCCQPYFHAHKKTGAVVLGSIILVLSFSFRMQLPAWKDIYSLLENTNKYYPSEEMLYKLAIEHYCTGNKKEAFVYIDKADQLGTDIWVNNGWAFYIQRASIYYEKGDSARAEQDVKRALKKSGNAPEAIKVINKIVTEFQ